MANVTVVIPTYNQGSFLKKAIQSVIDQTYVDWELIVINNHSEDNTIEIFNSFDDKRIKLINYSNKGIIAASRNIGIKSSSSNFIAFLDSDDNWYPRKLQDCLDLLSSGYDLVCHSELWVSNDKPSRKVDYGPEPKATFNNLLLKGNCLSPSAVVVKRDFLIKVNYFDEDILLVTAEDYDLWIRLAKVKCRIGFLNKTLGEFIIHENSNSGDILKNTLATISVIEKNINNFVSNNLMGFFLILFLRSRILYNGSKRFWKKHDFKNAIYFCKNSIKSNPLYLKSYLFLILLYSIHKVNIKLK
jgi:teichuronic acid biosynthesis glycosyltransferase TuaG